MLSSHLHQLLQLAEWASNFDERSLQRGADYARRQRVTSLQFSTGERDDACTLEGIIRGSEKQPYRCRVAVQNHGNWLTLDTDCSCPVGNECKHAAAMLLIAANLPPEAWPDSLPATPPAKARNRPAAPIPSSAGQLVMRKLAASGQLDALQKLLPSARADLTSDDHEMAAWSQWLRRLETLHSGHATIAAAERQFGVLLRSAEYDDRLLVNPVWLRPGKTKRASLVDPQSLQLDENAGALPAPAGGWPVNVGGALAMLLHDQSAKLAGQYWTAIHASHQEQALDAVLQHFPVYFEKGSVPLQRGPVLPLQIRWESLPDGGQRLAAHVAADESPRLLRGAGLWYVLPRQRIYGRVDGDPTLLDGIDLAPVVQPEQVDALRLQLQQRKATLPLPLPLPEPRAPVQIISTRPMPVLQLRVIELPLRDRNGKRAPGTFGCARLTHDYDGHSLPPDPRRPFGRATRLMHGEQVLEITRDPVAESEAEEQLENRGMVEARFYAWEHGIRKHPLDENDFLLQPNERKPPSPPHAWKPLLDELVELGFRIDYGADFPHDELVEIEDWHADLEASGNQWFDVSLGVDVGGERIDLLPVLRRLLADPAFPRQPAKGEKKHASWRVLLDETRSADIPLSRLRTLIEPLLEWLEGDGELRLHRSQAPVLAALDEHLHWHGAELLRAHLDALQNLQQHSTPPRGFKATLRPYQCDGLAWLDFLGAAGLGGILADDMGLGKTVQVLAHILGEKQRGRLEQPALVVAPTSLVGNWQSEAARFAPALKVLVIHGAARADRYDEIASHDLIITTYPLLPRDREQLLQQRFALLVLDEAQAIKNANSQAARVVREIPATRRLAMTGTPLENHLGELWAQFDAVEPGLLGSQRQFTKLYRTPIEKHADTDRQQRLNRRIGPLLLRRRKDDVLTDLPAKTEIVHTLELEGDQRALYETLRLAQHERVQQAVKDRGLAQSGIIVLDALLKLRQACCDPRLVKLDSARKITASAKLDALLELLDGLLDEGRRILLFSQFTEMLALIENALQKRKIGYQMLTGQTPARERSGLVKRFQDGGVPVFLISLKAGGVGLNLTAADTVIHYDPWWNPAAEAQATDRAHRIGQDKPVFVYRLICSGTVEEKIQAMQGRKAELARAVLEGGGATQQLRFNETDLAELFAPL
ncbi:MAG: helicase SNF2 [Rhodanobacter sp.]|nr:MAG: helicase SNF2 [Rhodanobacter sp.]